MQNMADFVIFLVSWIYESRVVIFLIIHDSKIYLIGLIEDFSSMQSMKNSVRDNFLVFIELLLLPHVLPCY